MRPTVLLAALCAVLLASGADARPSHHQGGRLKIEPSFGYRQHHGGARKDRQILFERKYESPPIHIANRHGGAQRVIPPALHRVMATGAGRIVGGRPAGCPRRYCGCGASLHIFGRIIPSLNLAANWLRFPRAAPAPGMVAARRGHVFVLRRHISGKTWLVWDANSGRGKTRIHPRSIAGFKIVNPHGSRVAVQ